MPNPFSTAIGISAAAETILELIDGTVSNDPELFGIQPRSLAPSGRELMIAGTIRNSAAQIANQMKLLGYDVNSEWLGRKIFETVLLHIAETV